MYPSANDCRLAAASWFSDDKASQESGEPYSAYSHRDTLHSCMLHHPDDATVAYAARLSVWCEEGFVGPQPVG